MFLDQHLPVSLSFTDQMPLSARRSAHCCCTDTEADVGEVWAGSNLYHRAHHMPWQEEGHSATRTGSRVRSHPGLGAGRAPGRQRGWPCECPRPPAMGSLASCLTSLCPRISTLLNVCLTTRTTCALYMPSTSSASVFFLSCVTRFHKFRGLQPHWLIT